MSKPDNQLFRDIYQHAKQRYDENIGTKFWDGQLCGSPVWNRFFFEQCKFDQKEFDTNDLAKYISDKYSMDFAILPYKFITPIDSFSLFRLYNWSRFAPPPESVGVHWYAGDRFNSKPFEAKVNAENYNNYRCYLTEAIQVALRDDPGLQPPEGSLAHRQNPDSS